MIDFTKYNLNEDDIDFLIEIEECCINGQNEIILEYQGKSFVLQPSGKEITVYAYGETLGEYKNFDDFILHHKIDGKPFVELIKDLDFGD